jgi:hypothetical protein
MPSVADWRLETRSENEGWPITQEHRKEAIDSALEDLRSEKPKVKDAARKYLLAVDLANMKKLESERKRIEAEHARKLQLIETAVKLGLVANVGIGTGAIPSKPSSSVGK